MKFTMREPVLNKHLATLPGVQAALDDHVLKAGAKAEAKLAKHRDTGDSKVDVEAGDVDRYLVLDDTASPHPNAMAIEYQLNIIRSAMGLGR